MSENVWVIDDDQSIRWVLERAYQQEGMQVKSFSSADSALRALHNTKVHPDAIVSDIRMPGLDGLDFLKQIHQGFPDTPVIIMTAHSDLDSAVAAYEGGAFEYLPKPFDVDEAIDLTKRACHASKESSGAQSDISQVGEDYDIIGNAPAMQEVFRAIGRLSRSNITVMINGESGTGKELIARALHRHSPRADAPFIALNMAAIPHELMESELFGHEKGAFTGAHTQRQGRFEQADTGTLFLDEIGDMPSELQTRLLRVLADGQFYRVGGHVPIKVDVRIIAATHQNLEQLVTERRFREDLFHRLNVIRVHVPSLRERREDIPVLLRHFLTTAASELQVTPKKTTKSVEEYLQRLNWPGNVRQLQNVARWLTVMASGNEILMEDLPEDLKNTTEEPEGNHWENELQRWVDSALHRGDKDLLSQIVPTFEKILIESALRKTGNRRQDAAKLLGWGRNTLTRKIKELDID